MTLCWVFIYSEYTALWVPALWEPGPLLGYLYWVGPTFKIFFHWHHEVSKIIPSLPSVDKCRQGKFSFSVYLISLLSFYGLGLVISYGVVRSLRDKKNNFLSILSHFFARRFSNNLF